MSTSMPCFSGPDKDVPKETFTTRQDACDDDNTKSLTYDLKDILESLDCNFEDAFREFGKNFATALASALPNIFKKFFGKSLQKYLLMFVYGFGFLSGYLTCSAKESLDDFIDGLTDPRTTCPTLFIENPGTDHLDPDFDWGIDWRCGAQSEWEIRIIQKELIKISWITVPRKKIGSQVTSLDFYVNDCQKILENMENYIIKIEKEDVFCKDEQKWRLQIEASLYANQQVGNYTLNETTSLETAVTFMKNNCLDFVNHGYSILSLENDEKLDYLVNLPFEPFIYFIDKDLNLYRKSIFDRTDKRPSTTTSPISTYLTTTTTSSTTTSTYNYDENHECFESNLFTNGLNSKSTTIKVSDHAYVDLQECL